MKKSRYDALSKDAKKQFQKKISFEYPDFKFYRCQHFFRDGIDLFTGIFLYEGAYFVFLPAVNNVALGWEEFKDIEEDEWGEGLDEETLNALLSEKNYLKDILDLPLENKEALTAFLRQYTSPIRKGSFPAMLVEVDPRSLMELAEEVPLGDPSIIPLLEEFRQKGGDQMEFINGDNAIIIQRDKEGEIIAKSYTPISLEILKETIGKDGFELPSEDLWEYLRGGETRSLFPWGDSVDLEISLEDEAQNSKLPNHFGVSIAYDAYLMEIVDSLEVLFKGGDGGAADAYGCGRAMSMLKCSTYYRQNDLYDAFTSEALHAHMIFRRVLVLKEKKLVKKNGNAMN